MSATKEQFQTQFEAFVQLNCITVQLMHWLQACLKEDSDFSSLVMSQEARPECCSSLYILLTPVQREPRAEQGRHD